METFLSKQPHFLISKVYELFMGKLTTHLQSHNHWMNFHFRNLYQVPNSDLLFEIF